MNRVCSIFSQVLQLIPRAEFAALVRQHGAERHARGFTCWQQLVAMLFCQLGHAQSLREIRGGLAASEGKLRHLGGRHKFRFKHKLLSLDSSMVELCAEVFDWAQYKRAKGALKLHLVLDHAGG